MTLSRWNIVLVLLLGIGWSCSDRSGNNALPPGVTSVTMRSQKDSVWVNPVLYYRNEKLFRQITTAETGERLGETYYLHRGSADLRVTLGFHPDGSLKELLIDEDSVTTIGYMFAPNGQLMMEQNLPANIAVRGDERRG